MDSRQYRAKYLLYKNSLFNVMGNVYYVYMYYLKSTDEVFYVGKGKNDRYKSMVHRNALFLNILNKHKDDVDVKFYKEHLSEDESFESSCAFDEIDHSSRSSMCPFSSE